MTGLAYDSGLDGQPIRSRRDQTKYVVITGGVLSGLGKGTATASIGRLLKTDGKNILVVKCDGYLNVDPGTMNPIEHGEVFVLKDGTEVDMDFGHYERFIGVEGRGDWNITSGKLFLRLIEKERKGLFLGRTIQVIPHVVNEVLDWWMRLRDEHDPDYMLIEIGGTVGDIENSWFLEAARRLKHMVGQDNIAYVHLTYLPMLHNTGELKTKPAQRDLALLGQLGIHPDIVIARSRYPLNQRLKEKISLAVDLPPERIITGLDVKNIYELPIMFHREGLTDILSQVLHIDINPQLDEWTRLLNNMNTDDKVSIVISGKYTALHDSYASVLEALKHAGAHNHVGVEVRWVETTDIERGRVRVEDVLDGVDGVIVPGGFGKRGVEGKMKVIEYVRENRIPFLGICLGLQLAVIEYARNVCGLSDANSTEFDPGTPHPVIDLLPEQRGIDRLGGTMRLGSYPAHLREGSLVHRLYGEMVVHERHRHRYEVNPEYHSTLEENGLVLSGLSPNGRLVEFIELSEREHPYFVATQSHPELQSRFESPAPLFFGLVGAAKDRL